MHALFTSDCTSLVTDRTNCSRECRVVAAPLPLIEVLVEYGHQQRNFPLVFKVGSRGCFFFPQICEVGGLDHAQEDLVNFG